MPGAEGAPFAVVLWVFVVDVLCAEAGAMRRDWGRRG